MEPYSNYPSECSSQRTKDDCQKEFPCETTATDSSEMLNILNDTRACETNSSISFTPIDTDLLDGCHKPHNELNALNPYDSEIVLGVDDEISHASSTFAETFNTINSDEDAYHSLTDLNSPSPSIILNSPSPTITEQLIYATDLQSTYEDKVIEATEPISVQSSSDEDLHIYHEDKSSSLVNQKKEGYDDMKEIREIKKFNTSSWNLEAIMESLYSLPEPKTSKDVHENFEFQKPVFVMSRASFCNYSEGIYTVKLSQCTLSITEGSNSLMTIPMKYADLSVIDGNCLKLDNKLGRCLFFKCRTQEELRGLEEELQLHYLNFWESESLNLVHYPLKCSKNVVIIDLGSCSTRAGILMDQPTLPLIFFPSVCATNKTTGEQVYGKEALNSNVRKNSSISFPLRPSIKIIKHSIDINIVTGLFKKIFHDLNVDPTLYTVQVCLPRTLSINSQNALVKLLLEDLNVQSVSLTHQALLTLYAHKVSTGIVVDVGDRMDILPVVDGFIVESGVTRLPYGGERLIHHMKHALAEKHVGLSNDIDSFVVQYISESLSYVAEDYENELGIVTQCPDMGKKSIAVKTFTDDEDCIQYVTLDTARFKIPEGLFKPDLWGLDNPGIHKLVQKAIQAASVDVRKKIAENIYVSGGVTTMPGFVERLNKEVANLNKPRITPKVIASNYRYHCTYIGACEFARMEVFPQVCVSSKEYRKNPTSALKKFVLCF